MEYIYIINGIMEYIYIKKCNIYMKTAIYLYKKKGPLLH